MAPRSPSPGSPAAHPGFAPVLYIGLGALVTLGVVGLLWKAAFRPSAPPSPASPVASVLPKTAATPTPKPAVVADRNSSRLRGAPAIPEFRGFTPIPIAKLPRDPVTSAVLVGRVNGEPLTLDQLTARVRRLRMIARNNLDGSSSAANRRIQVLPGLVASTQNEATMLNGLIAPAFDNLLETVVSGQLATSFGLTRRPVDATALITDSNKLRPAGWKLEDELVAAGRTMDDLRNDLETQDLDRRLVEHIMTTQVDPATTGQIQAYLSQPDTLTSRSKVVVRMRQVAIPLEENAPEQRVAHARRIAEMALSSLMGGTSWSVVAGRYSYDNLTRNRGGDLGWISPEDTDPAIREVITHQAILSAPQIVRTARAIHVIQVTGREVGDAQVQWRRAEALRILREMRSHFRQTQKIERYIP